MRIKTNDKYTSIVLKNIYENVKQEIELTAILNWIYVQKVSSETIHTKLEHQFNSMHVSIDQINPRFAEKSKKYPFIKQQIFEILEQYEAILKQFCKNYDDTILEVILKKTELEFKLLMTILCKEGVRRKNPKSQKQNSEECKKNSKDIMNLEKEIKKSNAKLHDLNDQKIKRVFEAMEEGNKALSTQIKKPRRFKNIKRFFTNQFNTYHVIQKTVLEPINERMQEFMINELKKTAQEDQEFNLQEIQNKIDQVRQKVLEDPNHKNICKELGILEEN